MFVSRMVWLLEDGHISGIPSMMMWRVLTYLLVVSPEDPIGWRQSCLLVWDLSRMMSGLGWAFPQMGGSKEVLDQPVTADIFSLESVLEISS